MALINCKECGNKISDKATTCPMCGYPIKNEKIEEEPEELGKWTKMALVVIGILFLLLGLYHMTSGTSKILDYSNDFDDKITYNETDDTYTIELYNINAE